ncbi:hypothetical protein ACFE04_012106 [Oxalis oulophora]
MEESFWFIWNLVSCLSGLLLLFKTHFIKILFGDATQYSGIISSALLFIIVTSSMFRSNKIQSLAHRISNNPFGCIAKTVIALSIMSFTTVIDVAVQNPHFRKSKNQQEMSVVSAVRAYCQSKEALDLQMQSFCLHLLKEDHDSTNQGHSHRFGFYSAVAFSLFAFGMSRKFRLPEEYGVLNMCLGFTLNAAVNVPGKGGSILDWKLMFITASSCFALIVMRNILGFFDHQKRRSHDQNGDNGTSGAVSGYAADADNDRVNGAGSGDSIITNIQPNLEEIIIDGPSLEKSPLARCHMCGERKGGRLMTDAISTDDNVGRQNRQSEYLSSANYDEDTDNIPSGISNNELPQPDEVLDVLLPSDSFESRIQLITTLYSNPYLRNNLLPKAHEYDTQLIRATSSSSLRRGLRRRYKELNKYEYWLQTP